MLSKSEIRRAMMAKRQALSADEPSAFSNTICESLARFLSQLEMPRRDARAAGAIGSPRVGLYASMRNEINLAPLAIELRQRGFVTAYPVVAGRQLRFIQVDADTPFRTSGFQVPEPAQGDELPASSFDVFLVPALAFDPAGHRIGYGGGYYDRLFASLATQVPAPTRVGVAYEFQVQDALPHEPHDAVMDYVVTECRIVSCHRGTSARAGAPGPAGAPDGEGSTRRRG